MRILAFVIFIPLQLIWLPISLLAAICVAIHQLGVSRRLGVSQTAIEIINGRWTMDWFGLREDIAARRLAAALPNTSVVGLWLCLLPLWIGSRIAGGPFLYPTLPDPAEAQYANLVPSRTVVFDAVIAAHLEDCEQFVVLGAGLDTRAYGPIKHSALTIFECDQARDQAHKRRYLDKAGIDASHVHFVTLDFAQENWITALLDSDYDPAKRTIFLWEGVTLYLARQSVEHTLSLLKANSAAGSRVIADIYAHSFLKWTKSKAFNWSLELTGEQTGFGLDFTGAAETELHRFVSAQGLSLGRHQFLGANGENGAYVVIAEMVD